MKHFQHTLLETDKYFTEIVEQYEELISWMIYSLKIYKDKDEFYQIGLIALWEAYQRFDCKKGNFSAFAYSYIRGRMLNELSKQKKSEEKVIYPDDTFWLLLQGEENSPFDEKEILLSYCNTLTNNQKKWVLYTFLDDLSINEIAVIEGVSPSAVKAWRKGAKEKIRKMLLEEK